MPHGNLQMSGIMAAMLAGDGFDATDPHLMKVLQLTKQYIGFPRQLGAAYRAAFA